jgi:hypothetical protein
MMTQEELIRKIEEKGKKLHEEANAVEYLIREKKVSENFGRYLKYFVSMRCYGEGAKIFAENSNLEKAIEGLNGCGREMDYILASLPGFEESSEGESLETSALKIQEVLMGSKKVLYDLALSQQMTYVKEVQDILNRKAEAAPNN